MRQVTTRTIEKKRNKFKIIEMAFTSESLLKIAKSTRLGVIRDSIEWFDNKKLDVYDSLMLPSPNAKW